MNLIFLTILNSLLLVVGQLLFKTGTQKVGLVNLSVHGIFSIITNSYVFSGLCLYAGTTVLWLYILSRGELSVLYPIQSMAFVFTLFAGYFLFGEPITVSKLLGTTVIVIGVFLVTR